MAVITPKIGGGSPGPAPVATSVKLPDPGQAFRAASEVSGELAQMVEEDVAISDRIRAVEIKGEYRRRLNERLAEADAADPNYLPTLGQDFGASRDDALRDHGILSSDILDQLELDLAEIEQAGIDAAAVNRRGALKDKALRERDRLKLSTLEMIRDDPDAAGIALADFRSSVATLAPAIPPGELADLEQEFGAEAIEARVEGLVKATRFGEAAELIDAAGGQLEPDHRRRLMTMVGSAQTAMDKTVAADFSRQIADIDVAIAAGETPESMDRVIAEISRMDSLGMWEGNQTKRGSLTSEALNKRARLIDKDKETVAALQALGRGPISQSETDLASVPIMQAAEQQDVDPTDALVQLASQAGHIPTNLREHLKAAEKANDASALAGAAALHRRLSREVPGVDTGIKQDGRVALVDVMHRYFGMDLEQAAQQVIAQVPDQATREARGKAWEDLAITGADLLDDTSVAPDISWMPFTTGQTIPDEAVVEASEVARQAYILTADEDVAKAMAVDGMRKRWGMSQVGQERAAQSFAEASERGMGPLDILSFGTSEIAEGRVMKYPPEDHFPAIVIPKPEKGLPGMAPETRALVMDDLVQSRLSAAGWPATRKYRLIPTEDTERRLAAGLAPAYYVSVPSRFGAYAETGPIVEQLDGGTERRVVIYAPNDEADLSGSKTYREWKAARLKKFRERGLTGYEKEVMF